MCRTHHFWLISPHLNFCLTFVLYAPLNCCFLAGQEGNGNIFTTTSSKLSGVSGPLAVEVIHSTFFKQKNFKIFKNFSIGNIGELWVGHSLFFYKNKCDRILNNCTGTHGQGYTTYLKSCQFLFFCCICFYKQTRKGKAWMCCFAFVH